MDKKGFAILNLCVVFLFAIYLVSSLFSEYPKSVKIIVLSIYLIYAIFRAIIFVCKIKK